MCTKIMSAEVTKYTFNSFMSSYFYPKFNENEMEKAYVNPSKKWIFRFKEGCAICFLIHLGYTLYDIVLIQVSLFHGVK